MKKKIIPLLVVSALSFGGLFGCSADIPTDTGPNYGDSVLGKDAEIVSITKTGSDGLVDTYTILYGDGKTTTFTVTNGKDGEQGIEGKPGSDGHTPTITIGANGNWYIDGVDSNISAKGEKGDKGDTGETGPQGPAGDKGDKGDTGEKGDTAWSNTILPVEGGYVKVNVGSALVGEDVTFTLVAKNGYFAEELF